ncbi:MAG: FHA domain-containing protein, partial [Polyangiaceae bacterium]|nr:FHA domain-containing protein [Polyangiaceae bacterium]
MSIVRFEIRYADGRREVAHVEGDRMIIGHGAHCDVRLPLDQAANEHVAVEVVGGSVRVETMAFDPPATVNGMPFTNIPILPDVPLKIGSTRIFLALGDADFDGAVIKKQGKEGISPAMKVLGVLVLVAGGFMAATDTTTPMPQAPDQLPDLFGSANVQCPQSTPDAARATAEERFDVAEGKRERTPFAPKEGVQAVDLYAVAAACFRKAGEPDRAKEADARAEQLRTSITQDFRARRVRLEHLMATEDFELARSDVNVLQSLTVGKGGPW